MIGTLVRQRRLALGLTQVELGRRTGLVQNYISKLEKGEVDLPQRGTLEALAGALSLPIADFYRAAGILLEADEDVPRAESTPVDELVAEFERQLFAIPGLRAQLERRKVEDPEDYAPLIRSTARHLGILAGSLLRDPGNGDRA